LRVLCSNRSMRKWMRDRLRRRKNKAEPGAAPEPQEAPLQPQDAGGPAPQSVGEVEFAAGQDADTPPESLDPAPASNRPQLDSPSEGGGSGSRGRSRGRRRRKKPGPPRPASAPPQSAQPPLQPAYTDTVGPRAPVATPFAPGGPTGEAAELSVSGEEEPAAPAPARVAETPAKRVPKGAVILSVGLPGSGKTTWFKRRGVTPLSSDLLRSLLFDDPTEQRHQDLVFSSLRSLLRARLMARMPQNYVDATNLSPKERRHWIRMARDFGYEAHAVYFDVPLETCMDRNRRRQRVVPEDVMRRMSAKLRPPAFEEGFSKIIVVRVKQRPAGEAEPEGEIEPEE
jgi:predicted kinase